MKFRSIALAAVAVASFGAQAGLVTYGDWDAFQPDAKGIDGVKFNVVTNTEKGVTVAMGAHAYKNGAYLANNGVDTFYASNGIFSPDDPGKAYANWSFDFFITPGTSCGGCTASLFVDTDPTAGAPVFVQLFKLPFGQSPAGSGDSWNMEMNFADPVGFGLLPGNELMGTYNFNPFSASSTAFALVVNDSTGGVVARSEITVNVPEPGTMALVGLALAGMGLLRRRKA